MNRIDKTRYVRWLLDFLFSIYSSAVYVVNWYGGSNRFIDEIQHCVHKTDKFLIASFHVSPFKSNVMDPDYFTIDWMILAILTFICVRLLGQVRFLERFIPFVGVCVAVAGPLYSRLAPTEEWYFGLRIWLLRIEVAAVIVTLLLYSRRVSTAFAAICFGILVAHFWFWGWFTVSVPDTSHTWFTMDVLVLLPLCTTSLWVIYTQMTLRPAPTGPST